MAATRTVAVALTDAASLIALVAGMTRDEKLALRAAMRAGETPEQAAASAAYVGHGHPCTATPPCSRTLRTAKGAASHDPARGTRGWHNAG